MQPTFLVLALMASDLRVDISPFLETFQVDPTRGFLPKNDPILTLGVGFEVWESTAREIPQLLEARKIREAIEKLPDFAIRSLKPEQCEFAFLMLSMLTNAYVHAENPSAIKIPAVLAVPFVDLAGRLGRPPILSHASLVLHNWQRMDPKGPIGPENLQPIFTFRNTPDEAWFYHLTTGIEAKGAKAVHEVAVMLRAAKEDQEELVEEAITNILEMIPLLTQELSRMQQGCDPEVFYEKIRPYLNSFHKVRYEGILDNEVRSYAGGSAAQSSLLQALEIGLGIPHQEDHSATFLLEMRRYMPPAHRSFLSALERTAPAFVEFCEKYPQLQGLRRACALELQHFRNAHLKLVSQYILAHTSQSGPGHTGTGGTDPMPFLRQLRNDNGAFSKG